MDDICSRVSLRQSACPVHAQQGDSVSDKDVGGDKQQLGWLAFVMLRCGGGHR